MEKMNKPNYSEEQIHWALEELRKKGVTELTRERAVKLLDTFKEFEKIVASKIDKDKKSGKLKTKEEDNRLN